MFAKLAIRVVLITECFSVINIRFVCYELIAKNKILSLYINIFLIFFSLFCFTIPLH